MFSIMIDQEPQPFLISPRPLIPLNQLQNPQPHPTVSMHPTVLPTLVRITRSPRRVLVKRTLQAPEVMMSNIHMRIVRAVRNKILALGQRRTRSRKPMMSRQDIMAVRRLPSMVRIRVVLLSRILERGDEVVVCPVWFGAIAS